MAAMRFTCLGSGSQGNALVVEAGRTRVMLDCGFGIRETVGRLERAGLAPHDITGIVVTHEHSDHIGGVARFSRKYDVPVWLTHGTHSHLLNLAHKIPVVHLIDSHTPFSIQDIEIQPFPVPHDAREPAQFVFSDGVRRLGVLTDTGSSTPHIEATLGGCHALVLECNHDSEMLSKGPYPPGLKQRVAGRFGHLDNAAAARLLQALDTRSLQHLVAAHLSQQNNLPQLAQAALSAVLNCAPEWIGIADQEQGFGWRDIA